MTDAEDIWITITSEKHWIKFHLCCVFVPPKDSKSLVTYYSKVGEIVNEYAGEIFVIC